MADRAAIVTGASSGIGFALEGYDSIGHFRTMDNGFPVDAKTNLMGTDVDRPIDGAVQLAEAFAGSRQVQRCATVEWFRYAFGRNETTRDQCTISALDEKFGAANQSIQELLVATAASDAFIRRPAPEGQ